MKADSFSTRDVVDMLIDDIDDPLNNLGGKNQVKGFIKQQGPGNQKGKKKKKKKTATAGDNGGLYESVKKIKTHEKFENEIDEDLVEQNQRLEDENIAQDELLMGAQAKV